MFRSFAHSLVLVAKRETMAVKMPVVRMLLLLTAVSMLGACGLWSREAPGEAPAPLPEFVPSFAPEVLWSRSIGSGGDRYLWKMHPAVLEDRVLVADVGGRLVAVDRRSGAILWSRTLDGATVASGVASGEGQAVVGTMEGQAIAFSPRDGSERWRVNLSSEVIALSRVVGNLVVARTNDGRLHALEADTGLLRWSAVRATPGLSLRGAHTPQMLPGRVLAGFDTGALVLLDAGRGQVLWETAVALPSGRSELERMVDLDGHIPLFRDAFIASSYQGRLTAVDIDDGQLLWARSFSSFAGADVHIESETLVATSSDSHVWGFDVRNGGDLWQQSALRLRGLTAPVALENSVVVGDFQGYLHWLSWQDGSLLARARVGSRPIVTRPVLDDGILYVLTGDGQLSAVRGRTGG